MASVIAAGIVVTGVFAGFVLGCLFGMNRSSDETVRCIREDGWSLEREDVRVVGYVEVKRDGEWQREERI